MPCVDGLATAVPKSNIDLHLNQAKQSGIEDSWAGAVADLANRASACGIALATHHTH
jgi:hypothetical protein